MQGRINTLLADKLRNEDRIAKLTSDNQKLTIHKHNMETVHINILRTIEENSIVYNRLLKRIPFPAVDDYIGLENYYQNIVSTLTRCYATLQYHQTRSLGFGTSEKTHGRNEEEPVQQDNLELCNDITDLSNKYKELSNQTQKQIETIKNSPRPLTDEEIENLQMVKQLIKDNNALQNFYAVTPDDFSFRVTADDLKTKKFGLFHEETAQGAADRINLEIRKQISPIIQNNKALSKQNKDLTDKVKDLESKNSYLSNKVKALTDEVKEIYQTLCIPFKNTIKERLNSFKGWLNDFLFGDEEKLDEMRAEIFRKNDDSESIDKLFDNELGFKKKIRLEKK